MLAHQDSSMAVEGISRHDISVIRDNDYQNHRPQRELDELEASKTRHCCKKTAKFLFSHIGLVGLVVVYSIAGGFLFELLEQHQDQVNCREAQGQISAQMTQLKQQIVSYVLYNTTASSSADTSTYLYEKDNTTVAYTTIGNMLYNFRNFVINTGAQYRYYGDNCSMINKWTYPNSLLFAITIITTIGYGNITPVTWEGQICCICYATIGIPIFLLCVANISGVLGEMFRFLYKRVFCKPYYMIKKHRALARKRRLAEESGMDINRVNNNGWSTDDNNNDNSIKKPINTFMNEMDGNPNDQEGNRRIAIPLTITMLIIAFYIWFGSLLFHKFEQWTMIQSGYFCFITLATIGFGDFVPGQAKDDPNAGAKLILGAIYVLFGMAILAMCFDLMQEEIVAKFRWIGRKIGIVEKEEDSIPNQNDKTFDNKNRPSSTVSSMADQINGKMNEDENENEWSTQRSSSATRKHSPRNNITRVHPMIMDSNEGTLHQRSTATKFN